MTPRILAREILTLEGMIYTPGQTIAPDAGQRLSERERNTLLKVGDVRQRET